MPTRQGTIWTPPPFAIWRLQDFFCTLKNDTEGYRDHYSSWKLKRREVISILKECKSDTQVVYKLHRTITVEQNIVFCVKDINWWNIPVLFSALLCTLCIRTNPFLLNQFFPVTRFIEFSMHRHPNNHQSIYIYISTENISENISSIKNVLKKSLIQVNRIISPNFVGAQGRNLEKIK